MTVPLTLIIDGVNITPLRRIPDERGVVMHMLRSDAPHFQQFGEIYFSGVNPGAIKAWRQHQEMTMNLAVPVGVIKLVLYDDRPESPTRGSVMEFFLGGEDYCLVTIPPKVWNGYQGLSKEMALVANCATQAHRADEIIRQEPTWEGIPYQW